jgi:hypothetical protein
LVASLNLSASATAPGEGEEIMGSALEQRKASRLQIMSAIYDKAGDNTDELVDLWAIREALGLTDDEMGNAVSYLAGEGLIDLRITGTGQRTPMRAHLTHRGVVEMEQATGSPERATEHFPPLNSVVVHIGNVTGSALQIGAAGSTQNASIRIAGVGEEVAGQIRQFLDAFAERVPELRAELAAKDLAEVTSDVETVQSQINSPKPKSQIIKTCLGSIKAVLEHAVGGAAAAGLLSLLSLIHF